LGLAEAVKVLARGHQQLVWARQRQANMLRSALRAFYPAALAAFGNDPGGRDAVAVLGLAPTPALGRALAQAELVAALRRAGRRRQVDARAAAIHAALAGQQLEAPPVVAAAYGQVVAAAVAVIASLSEQLASLEAALTSAFGAHRDAGIVRSQPGLGVVLVTRQATFALLTISRNRRSWALRFRQAMERRIMLAWAWWLAWSVPSRVK
jgi:hypothetical protein